MLVKSYTVIEFLCTPLTTLIIIIIIHIYVASYAKSKLFCLFIELTDPGLKFIIYLKLHIFWPIVKKLQPVKSISYSSNEIGAYNSRVLMDISKLFEIFQLVLYVGQNMKL